LRRYPFYTALANLCDYSASAFPVLRVNPSIDVQELAHEFRSEPDKMVFDLYSNPEIYRDAPIGLQCIGMKNEEEAVIR
jgi:amidase